MVHRRALNCVYNPIILIIYPISGKYRIMFLIWLRAEHATAAVLAVGAFACGLLAGITTSSPLADSRLMPGTSTGLGREPDAGRLPTVYPAELVRVVDGDT